MVAHFICTNGDFPYFFYLTIKTTLKVCSFDKVILWCIGGKPQNNIYFDELEHQIEVGINLLTNMTANSLRYAILYEMGGFYMDWDGIAVKDIVPYLKDNDYFAFFQTEHGWDAVKNIPGCHWASILACCYIYAKKKSPMMQEALNLAKDFDERKELSPSCKAFYKVVSKNKDLWAVKNHEIVNPFWFYANSFLDKGRLAYPFFTCIDHWYFSNHPDFREKITPEFIKDSKCLYARTVREILC